MTPSQTEVGAPAVPGPSESAPDAQVLQELRAIDTSGLERLTEIRAEQTRLARYCVKGAELKGTVKEAVWQRVLGEYEARSSALEELAGPLKGELRREYQKLRALHARIAASLDEALLAKEEFEFREAVGELTKTDLKTKLDGPQATIDKCQRDLSAVETQKAKFVAAIGSEADLEEQLDPPRASLAKPRSHTKPSPTPERATTPERVVESIPPPEIDAPRASTDAVPIAAPVESDLTRVVTIGGPASRPGRFATEPVDPQQTSILTRATVFVTVGSGASTEYHLGEISLIGRTEDNHIRITGPGVSRRHALIKATPSGYTLKDFGSQNGTFVNGERVRETERPLAEGDRIVIGDVQILFRLMT